MADELSRKLVTVRYNQQKLLDCVAVRRAEMIVNQLDDTMKRTEDPAMNNRSLKNASASRGTATNSKLK
jgi:hypothetical protein